MTGLPLVLSIWAVVGGMIVIWLADAVAITEAPQGHRPDPTACACCRHDRIAHRVDESAHTCTQCPCSGFRAIADRVSRPGRRAWPPPRRR
jgi:hypothetical protein